MHSCVSTTYYYSTLDSSDVLVGKLHDGNFVSFQDSVRIIYNFYGKDAPLKVNILNLSFQQPMYIDWSKSFVVINDNITDYEDDDSIGIGKIDVIHPQSDVNYTFFDLSTFSFYNQISNKEYSTKKINKPNKSKKKVKSLDFLEYNSPLNIESYIAVYTDKNFTQPTILNNRFYVSNLMKAGGDILPSSIIGERGDIFYNKNTKLTTFSTVVGSTLILTGAILVGAVSSYITDQLEE